MKQLLIIAFFIFFFFYYKIFLLNDKLKIQDQGKSLIPGKKNFLSYSNKDLKNGDLIFISYNNYKTYFSRLFYSSIWTHVGMIYFNPKTNEPFVFEAAIYDNPYSCHIIRIPLIKWLSINRNHLIHVLPINREIPYDHLNKVFLAHEEQLFFVEDINVTWIRFYLERGAYFSHENNLLNPKIKSSGITCNELIVSILQHANVIKKEFSPSSYFPSDIYKAKFNMINGFSYDTTRVSELSLKNIYLIP